MAIKNSMTVDFLRNAYGGESMAHMRYLIWGEQAGKKGFPNISRLYKAISHAEYVHASNHFYVLEENTGGFNIYAGGMFGVKSVAENLIWAIEGEMGEASQMYPVYLSVAEFQGEKDAKRSFFYALEAEKVHASLFAQAREYALKNQDLPIGDDPIYICPVCGFTNIGEYAYACPICKAKNSLFIAF